MPWLSICTWAERDHHSTIAIVNFEYKTPCSSLSTVDFEHIFISWVWSFNNSIAFKLWWIQVPFIYIKDFLEVKHLHEEACTAPCLIFFKIYSKFLNWSALKVLFSNDVYKLFRVNFPGQKSFVTCSGRNFMRGQLFGGGCSVRNYSGKNVFGT